MPSLISKLSESEQKDLFECLYYLNTQELHSFCDKHSIPYRILIQTEKGKTRLTRDKDRKKIVINRITHYLKTGYILPATLFNKDVVNLSGLPYSISENDRLFYGCYEKKNPKMIALLEDLTSGEFKNGAIARILMREFWTKGDAPTFKEFAKAWLKARDDYSLKQHPEAAYLTDLSKGKSTENWKEVRSKKAEKVILYLETLSESKSL